MQAAQVPADEGGYGRSHGLLADIPTLRLAALAGIGLLAGGGLFLGDASTWTAAQSSFMRTPAALLWFLTLDGQWALWLVVAWPLVDQARDLSKAIDLRDRRRLGGALLLILALAGLLLVPASFATPRGVLGWWPLAPIPDYPLRHHDLKIAIHTIAGSSIALLAVADILLLRLATGLDRDPAPPAATYDAVHDYLERKDALVRLLWVGGAIVFAATLSVGALRPALVAGDAAAAARFPATYPTVYGLYLSGLLALVYVPTYMTFERVGRALQDLLVPPRNGPLDATDLVAYAAVRRDVEAALGLGTGPIASFKAGAFIFAPLASTIVAQLLPGS